jgi:predicted permease
MRQDIRLALRSILKSPSYAAMVVGSLAVGIAAPVLAFTMVNAAVFRPIDGVGDQDPLMRLGLTTRRGERWFMGSTVGLYHALRDELRDVVDMAAAVPTQFSISHDRGEPAIVDGEVVSPNYFDALRVRPAAGRLFAAADARPAHESVAVIGYEVWRRQFELSPDVIGQVLTVNGTPLEVVGVTPERFEGVTDEPTRVWIPFDLAELALQRQGRSVSLENAGSQNFVYFGRLTPDARLPQIEAAASAVVYRAADGAGERTGNPTRFSQQLLALNGAAPHGARVTGFWRGGLAPDALELVAGIGAAFALPLLVLAIACINAGNLVLARATRAAPAWTMQLALGASRGRLLRQPVIEALLLAIPAAVAALLVTRWGFKAIEDLTPFVPLIDWRVVLFTLGTAVGTPLLFGVGPVWSVLARARRGAPGRLVQVATPSRTRKALLVVQAALSVAFLGTGVQWVRTVLDGYGDGLGNGKRMVVAAFDASRMNLTREETDAFFGQVLERVKQIPGASRAAMLGGFDLASARPREGAVVWLPGDPPDNPHGGMIGYVTPGLLTTIGTPVATGRTFDPEEYGAPVRTILVNDVFVQQHLKGQGALGLRVRIAPAFPRPGTFDEGLDAVIVGVVRAAPRAREDSRPAVYAATPLTPAPSRTLYVPFDDAALAVASLAAVRDIIHTADRRVPHTLGTLDDARWQRSEPRRFMAIAVAATGTLALLLAAVGLYGAASYSVELRTREIGVRMAVGATSGAVLRAILLDALTVGAIACAIGSAGAAAGAILGRSMMYGASTIDPLAYGATIAILLATMLLASLVPAMRAARVDPVVALRAD